MKHDICCLKQNLIAGCTWVKLWIFLFSIGRPVLLWGQYTSWKPEGV